MQKQESSQPEEIDALFIHAPGVTVGYPKVERFIVEDRPDLDVDALYGQFRLNGGRVYASRSGVMEDHKAITFGEVLQRSGVRILANLTSSGKPGSYVSYPQTGSAATGEL